MASRSARDGFAVAAPPLAVLLGFDRRTFAHEDIQEW